MDNLKITLARGMLQQKYPQLALPHRSYLVLMSARSGSMLLCAHLERIGCGRPVEAFNPNKNPMFHNDWKIDFNNAFEYIKTAIDFQTVNGMMGMKLSLAHFHAFLEKARELLSTSAVGMNDAEVTEVFFPRVKYIHLQRRDKVKQAVSYAKAWQNGIWYETANGDEDYKEYLLPVVYDRQHLECCLDLVIAGDAGLSYYLQQNELPVLKVWYEELAADYSRLMGEIYEYLGITAAEIIAPPLKKQADSSSSEWEQRFTRETPWLKDPRIMAAMESGDMQAFLIERAQFVLKERANARWSRMTVNRYKGLRSLFFRIKRKLHL